MKKQFKLIVALVMLATIAIAYWTWPTILAVPAAGYFLVFHIGIAILLIFGTPWLYLLGLYWASGALSDWCERRRGFSWNLNFPHSSKILYAILLGLHILFIWHSPVYRIFLTADSGAPQHYIPDENQ